MPKIFSTIVELLRLDKPVGYLLVFSPALFGLFLAYEEPIDLYYIPVLFVGSVLARSSGCVINDFFDRDFDKQVLRTKNRPLANNTISTELALIILGLLLLLTMWTLLYFTIIPIIIGIIAFCMIVIYPLMKRFTYFPQVLLGLTFNLGCLISYAEIKDDISVGAFLMYIACGFWTFGYDSIYAFMDIKDDKSIGVKSSAIFLKDKNYKLFILCAYIIFMVLYVVANLSTNNYLGLIGGAIALFVLFWQVKSLDVTDPANCLIRFKSNVYVGFIMAFSMLLGCILN